MEVNVDIKNVQAQVKVLKESLHRVNNLYKELGSNFQDMQSWNDAKSKEAKAIVASCGKDIQKMGKSINQAIVNLEKILKPLIEYENTNLTSSYNSEGVFGIGGLNNLFSRKLVPKGSGDDWFESLSGRPHTGASNNLYDNSSSSQFTPLLTTRQGFKTVLGENGVEYSVYDHPMDTVGKGHVYSQGSAYQNMNNTCGWCAVATIINKAGGSSCEYDTVRFAHDHHLYTGDGFSWPAGWVEALNDAGISSRTSTGSEELSDLADCVENGQGLIIGVDVSALGTVVPAYDGYQGGHALVVESVVRNLSADTEEIVGYYVVDSNGQSEDDAIYFVPSEILEEAYELQGRMATLTQDIIW